MSKVINYSVDETVRSPEKADHTRTGLVQRLQPTQAGAFLVWNVMYLSHTEPGSGGESVAGDVSFLRLQCRGESPQKVQVQIKTTPDEDILAWCDYIRTNRIWMAVIPGEKPAEPPWDVYGVPIQMGYFKFKENIRPKSRAGKALDYIFTASGGEIPKSAFRSMLHLFR